jgi:hypothetical protein
MSQIQKIKSLMLIKEVQTQKPVTSPVNIEAVIMVLQQIYKIKPEYLDNINEYSDVDFLTQLSVEILDFISAFILLNVDKLTSLVSDKTQYIIPKIKTFFIEGTEHFSQSVANSYEMTYDAYNKEHIAALFSDGELHIWDNGELVKEEQLDAWDSEEVINSIEELIYKDKKVNEEVELDNYKSSFTTEEFVSYINSEFDLEMLELIQGVVSSRINTLNTIIDMSNRKEVKGFR